MAQNIVFKDLDEEEDDIGLDEDEEDDDIDWDDEDEDDDDDEVEADPYMCDLIHNKAPFQYTYGHYFIPGMNFTFHYNSYSKKLRVRVKNSRSHYYRDSCIGKAFKKMNSECKKEFMSLYPEIQHLL